MTDLGWVLIAREVACVLWGGEAEKAVLFKGWGWRLRQISRGVVHKA